MSTDQELANAVYAAHAAVVAATVAAKASLDGAYLELKSAIINAGMAGLAVNFDGFGGPREVPDCPSLPVPRTVAVQRTLTFLAAQ